MDHTPMKVSELKVLENSLNNPTFAGLSAQSARRLIQEIITLRELLANCIHTNWQEDPAQVLAYFHLYPRHGAPPTPDDPELRQQIMCTLDLARRALTTQQIHQIVGKDPSDALARMEALGQVRPGANDAWSLTPAPCG